VAYTKFSTFLHVNTTRSRAETDAVPGIKNIHYDKDNLNQDLLFTNARTPVIKPNPAASMPLDNVEHMQTFKENDWIPRLVKYDEKTYPGILLQELLEVKLRCQL